MSAEFSIDYELVMNAANTFENSSGQFKEISDTMEMLRQQLTTTWLVECRRPVPGKSAKSPQSALAQADEMRGDLLTTVQDFRDDVDPDISQRFQG